jgi:hypothetical protein
MMDRRFAYLQERHREFLEGVLIEGDDDDPATSEKEPVAVDAGNAWTPLRLNRRFPRFPSNCLTLRSSRSPSCRRSIDRHFNFVPHRFARRQVEVRLTASTVEIFRTAAHLHEAADNHGRARACAPESNRG